MDDAVILGTRRPYKEMTDGTLRVQIDIDPEDKARFLQMWPDTGDIVALVRLTDDVTRDINAQRMIEAGERPYADAGGKLLRSGFFRRPEVWPHMGTDAQFLEWLKGGTCVVAGRHSGDIVPAHVRRIAKGSGTGIKPPFSAVPMCNEHHQQQHNQGEGAVGGKEFLDKRAAEACADWAYFRIKACFDGRDLSQIPPGEFREWCNMRGIAHALPEDYE